MITQHTVIVGVAKSCDIDGGIVMLIYTLPVNAISDFLRDHHGCVGLETLRTLKILPAIFTAKKREKRMAGSNKHQTAITYNRFIRQAI